MGLFMKVVCKILLDQDHHVTIHKGQNPPPTKGVAKRMNCSLVDKTKSIVFALISPTTFGQKQLML